MEALHRATRLMALTGLWAVPAAAWLGGWRVGAGLASGMLWAFANAWTLRQLVRSSLSSQRVSRVQQVLLWAVKFPVLYGVGAILLLSPWSSPIGFLVGFSLWFVLLVVDAVREATA